MKVFSQFKNLLVLMMIVSACDAKAALITFDSLPSTSLLGGTPPASAVITTQLGSQGIHFGRAGLSTGVAVINNSSAFSLPNGINGLDANGDIVTTVIGNTYFNFVVPNTNNPGVVNSVSWVMGDAGGDLDEWTVLAFDLNNALLDTQNISSTSNISASVTKPGIHRIEIIWATSLGSGYLVDNISFATPTPEPATAYLLAMGCFGLSLTGHRRRKGKLEVTYPPFSA